MKRLAALSLLLGAVACEEGPREVPAEVRQARTAATRGACVTGELSRRAEDQYRSLESSLPGADGSGGELTRGVAGAALQFARLYMEHAELRAASAAQLDSAMNHSPRDQDSVRHVRAAGQYATRIPEPGTVEANVYTAYQQDLAQLLADPDHPCNWELEPADTSRARG